ncbi:GntR family transcriptional regulator [Microvirga pudoricolor]|uniref:GntR family transcriptional regulator n=1 Tax=Microvirga pudoricolor TaxID=2778729 RepID=UPI001951DBA6|nr:GntR family transcriptional regulator [Microvirga pudoricolor]MBM6596299.1 GntR family transcriptional regulator [Microvirga pudoricolor]
MTEVEEILDDRKLHSSHASNLSNLAYNALSDMIRAKQLRGGDVIVEARLTEVLGISRTPLREALQRLEGEGLVVKAGGRSFVVRQVDLREYLHSLKVRELLEAEAAALATGHIPTEALAGVRREIEELLDATDYHTHAHWQSDDNLHNLYIENCRNDVLSKMIQGLRVTTRLFEIARLADRLEPDSVEHLSILSALEAEDSKGARRAVAAHIRSLVAFALETVR